MGGYAYVAPATVDEALAVLGEHASAGTRAQVLAGGTDLLVQMRSVDRAPRTIVDVKQLEGNQSPGDRRKRNVHRRRDSECRS